MAENLYISQGASKSEIYQAILPQIKSLLSNESDFIANTANVAAVLKEAFNFFWVGFYFDQQHGELVLGPFQGPIACTRIKYDKGVCGFAFSRQETVIVPDVNLFPGHIACNSASQSEIVLILRNKNNEVIGVLDVDSEKLDNFDEIDQKYLEEILILLKHSS